MREVGLLIPGRSKEAPDGPLCPSCGKGKGYLIDIDGDLRHLRCWRGAPPPPPPPPPQPERLFDP